MFPSTVLSVTPLKLLRTLKLLPTPRVRAWQHHVASREPKAVEELARHAPRTGAPVRRGASRRASTSSEQAPCPSAARRPSCVLRQRSSALRTCRHDVQRAQLHALRELEVELEAGPVQRRCPARQRDVLLVDGRHDRHAVLQVGTLSLTSSAWFRHAVPDGHRRPARTSAPSTTPFFSAPSRWTGAVAGGAGRPVAGLAGADSRAWGRGAVGSGDGGRQPSVVRKWRARLESEL